MAAHYKSLIAANIARHIVTGSLAAKGYKSDVLEKEIIKLINVLPTDRDRDPIPNLALKMSDLSKFLKVKTPDEFPINKDYVTTQHKDFLYFTADRLQFSQRVLNEVLHQGSEYGYTRAESPKCVCVDFSSPNIAKPLHFGHIRSTVIGNVVCNMYEAVGHDVKRINFLGDWGTQFGLLTLGLQKYRSPEYMMADPMKHFYNVYTKINDDVRKESNSQNEISSETYQKAMELFSRLEKGDKDLQATWQEIKNISLLDLQNTYQRLGVQFTHTMPESQFVLNNRTNDVLKRLTANNLLKFDSEGVGYVPLDDKEGNRASVVKSDGSSLYLTRDIAAALERQEMFNCDIMHYVVEQGQSSHFENLVGVLKQMGVPWANRPMSDIHLVFGRVQGMSSRRGTATLLSSVLDEAQDRVATSLEKMSTIKIDHERIKSVAETQAISAIILQELQKDRIYNYKFDWNKMLSFKRMSGISLQYCHARLTNMLANCGVSFTHDIDLTAITRDTTLHQLLLHLARYPDVFETALFTKKPHHIVRYLFLLCILTNSAYKVCPVKNQPLDIAQARLAVFQSSRQVIRNCLTLLGVTPLDQL